MTTSLLTLCLLCLGQDSADDRRTLVLVREQARTFARAFQDDDHAKLADLTYTREGDKSSSRSSLIYAWKKKTAAYRNQGFQVDTYQVQPAKELVKAGSDWLCVLPTLLTFQAVEGPASMKSYLLALSHDKGKTWRYLAAADPEAGQAVKDWLPKLPDGFSLPAAGTVRVDKEEANRSVFSSAKANFKLSHSDRWVRGQLQAKTEMLALERGDDAIVVLVDELKWTVEGIVKAYARPTVGKPRNLYDVRDVTIAGAKAKFFRYDDSNDQQLLQNYVCVFTHQGLGYQILGVRRVADRKEFEADYLAILQRFAFLKDRAAWLKQHEGVPTATTLLGGLASFELPRPRWTEDTFDNQNDNLALDYATFKLLAGNGFMRISLYEAQGDLTTELQDILATNASRYQNAKTRAITFTTSKGKWPGMELQGLSFGIPVTLWMTAVVKDGIAAWLVLDMNQTQTEELRQDWEQLLDSFRLQSISRPDQPLAFPSRRNNTGQTANPRVAELLKKGKLLYPSIKANEVMGFTADGKQAFLNSNGYFLEDLATKKRDLLPLKGPLPINSVLSPDRKWVATQTLGEITLTPVGFGFPRKIRSHATMLAFVPGNKELLGIVSSQKPNNIYGGVTYTPFPTSRLERIPLDEGPSKAILDWPLIRVSHFSLSPNGKQLAVVTNRDYPRTQPFGGLLYVCKADGSDLRLLNKEPADYRSLAWSGDGKWIFALRSVSINKIGGVGAMGAFDVTRIAADNGETLKLTRSGGMTRMWAGGNDLFLDFRDYTLPNSQQGVYRFNADALAKDAPPTQGPKLQAPDVAAENIAKRLEKTLAGTPLRHFVPTAKAMPAFAKEFAAAVRDELGVTLDFTPESLDRFTRVIEQLEMASGRNTVNVLGAGAYYGETLRKVIGAQWHIKPVPFGDWLPGLNPVGNSVLEIVYPFSDCYRWSMYDGSNLLNSIGVKNRVRGQDWLLVFPPNHAANVMNSHAKDYLKARTLLDKGDVNAGSLGIHESDIKKRPHNGQLAREIISLYTAVGKHERAKSFTKQAVEAGAEAHDLLILYADELARTDPAKAIPYYRKAAHTAFAPPETLINMGQAYEKAGQLPVAESCWRRAYFPASDFQRNEIRRLMGLPPGRQILFPGGGAGLPFDDGGPFKD